MATRAATFTAKIRTLYDYHLRTIHNILPLPSGIDIANTLKYFSQTLLAVLRDVPTISLELLQSRELEHTRMSLFPNLDYKGFFHAVVQLVDIVPLIHYGATALGQAILHSLACLVPFLEHEYMDTLPYLVASCMALFPPILHKDIVNMLCNLLLPFTITPKCDQETHQNYATSSTAAVCMFVFQYSEHLAHYCQLLECLMSIKPNVLRDLLCVIAHGTSSARAPAANLLFYYWPSLNPALHDRRGIQVKFTGWEPLKCQRENCLSPVNNEAVKMCLDHSVAIGSGDHPPPLYICQDCADEIRRDQPDCLIRDVLLPLQQISMTCENKNCRSSDKTAISTCFSIECANYNGNHPIRYCSQCHTIRHNNRRGIDHVFHLSVNIPWQMDPETQNYMVEAIVSLLKEAQPIPDRRYKDVDERYPRIAVLDCELNPTDESILEERRLLSRYGIYLLVGLCTPTEDTPLETLGRLLGMLFQWFDALAYLPDDQAGNTLERLKSEYIHGWLMEVCQSNFEVFVSCLLPHPVEYARVGGHWDTLVNRTSHIKDGFNRLFCLVPYEIINPEVWDYIMPYWMEAIRNEVPEEELSELRILLSKVLDPEMSPLGFSAQEMYRFIAIRFQNAKSQVQEQALFWLQILSLLNVVVPLSLLFSMFTDGIKSCISPSSDQSEGAKVLHSYRDDFATGSVMGKGGGDAGQTGLVPDDQQISHILGLKTESELMLPCFVLMLDILLKQLQLQEVDPHQGIEHIVSRESLVLIENMVCATSSSAHECEDIANHDCIKCELITTFYQLALDIIEYISPVVETCKTDITTDGDVMGSDDSSRRGSPVEELSLMPLCQLADFPGSPQEQEDKQELFTAQLFTATVQTVLETELDTVAIMPTEEVVKAVARAVTLTETDVGLAKVSVVLPAVVDENDQTISKDAAEDDGTFWHTSQGKFKFTLDELPPQLKLIYELLKELSNHESADIVYQILGCLKFLCLHAECLTLAAKEHRGFLIWCQENLIITNLWNLLQAEHSHISQICVQILSHCITLPSGTDIFWKIIEENFNHDDWTIRSAAVEKVTMIARFVEREPVKQSQLLQSSFANAFCYLISSMDDIHATVAEKAMLCLDTIKDSSLRVLCLCLEIQFDTIILDRPMILQTMFQLYTHLNDRKILTWEFFLNRFDALFLETQVILERSGDIAYPKDLKNTDMNSETFLRKLNRAHEALSLSQSDSVRSLSMSLGAKLHYKRAMSAPSGMVVRQEKIGKNKEVDKEKLFSRQSSAPVLKRKCSKFGIAQVVGQLPNHLFPDGNLKEAPQEENNFLAMLHRIMEMDESDKDTMHLLIFLFMQFLSHPEHAYPSDEKAIAKIQNVVLRHLNVLLGYTPQDKGFCIPPYRLRSSPVFSSFLFSLPHVLDHNFKMGTLLLSTCLPLLHYCPSPQRCNSEIQQPTYSIWYLEAYARHSWLMAVLTFIYKYRYSTLPFSRHVQNIIRIILNTLEAQDHHCHQLPEGCLLTTPNASRSKDLGSVSTGDMPQNQDGTPPHSPGLPDLSKVVAAISEEIKAVPKLDNQDTIDSAKFSEGQSSEAGTASDRSDWAQWKPRKLADFSFSSDVEDEPELEAIPESPKSETPVESLQESLTELHGADDTEEEMSLTLLEKECFIENSVVVTSASLTTALKVMPLTAADNPVESEMALQIKAFNESFDKDKMDTAESVIEQLVKDPTNSFKDNKKILTKTRSFDDGRIYINKKCEGFLKLPGSICPSKSNIVQPVLKVEETFCQTAKMSTTEDVFQSLVPYSENRQLQSGQLNKIKLQRSKTMDCETSNSLKLDNSAKNLEILDARQLEESIRRREPTVISQSIQQTTSPYLFQPIQAHPITTHTSDVNGKYKLEQKSAQLIKVEPKPVADISNEPSITAANLQLTSPWTVKKHSPIQLEPLLVPKQERLLSIGQDKKEKDEMETKGTVSSTVFDENMPTAVLNSSVRKTITTSHVQEPLETVSRQNANSSQNCSKQSDSSPKRSITLQPLTGQVIKEGPHPRTFHIEPAVACQEEKPSCSDNLNRKTSWKLDPKMRSFFKYNIEQANDDDDKMESLSETDDNRRSSLESSNGSQLQIVPTEEKLIPFHNASSETTSLTKQVSNGSNENTRKIIEKANKGLIKQQSFSEFRCVDDQIPHAFHPVDSNAMLARSKSVVRPASSQYTTSDNCLKTDSNKHFPFDKADPMKVKDIILDKSQFVIDAPMQVTLKDMMETENEPPPRILRPSVKRLIKQNPITDVDLQHQSSGSTEGPSIEGGDDDVGVSSHHSTQDHEDQKGRFRRRQRKIGISSVEMQKFIDQRNSINRKSKKESSPSQNQRANFQPSSLRCGEDTVVEKCPECGAIVEQYSDEELSLCIVILATFIHREPALAAPTLPEIIRTVARIASCTMYAWQHESNVYLPGGASSVAKQFIRCVLHQLAPNGIFLQLFQSVNDDAKFFKTIASALTDFNELNPAAPLQLLLENLNDCKVLPVNSIQQILYNVAIYMECLPLETASSTWSSIIPQFDLFIRKLHLILSGQIFDMQPMFKIMISLLKIPGLHSFKSILDPFSKMLSHAIQNCSLIYRQLLELCHLCNRAFTKERDKLLLSRTAVFELVQAIKFKSNISDDNLLMLVQFVVQDAGGTLGPSMIMEELVPPVVDVQNMINTSACECMRQHLNDALDFVADVHTLSKVKSNFKGTMMGLNEDTLGAALKAGIAQYLALEITRGNNRDNRAISRYLPWLCNPPTAVQQGPKEFLDCVAHIRLLSWLLLGALTHTAMLGNNSSLVCQPIPLEASCHVADHIQVILTGFAEQSKASVLHMSSLFHAFILCQLWTMYCEQMASLNPPGSEHHNAASITLTDFWAKVTPSILQLLSHSKILAEMVNLHFLTLMEALLECNSTVLAKIFPLWSPLFYAYQGQLPGQLKVRLQLCEDRNPSIQTKDEIASTTHILLKWLQRLQFKMGQIELQSSTATQFYSV